MSARRPRRVAFFTIGQSPRSDVVPEMAARPGQLRRLLDVYGAAMDSARSSAENLWTLHDVDNVDGRRLPQLALLGVLGLSARERLRLVLAESAALGALGSALGIALGTGLAALALRQLGGDLGGGYFPGVSPPLRFGTGAALLYGALGLMAALVGGWWPARATARMAPALALKGLGAPVRPGARRHTLALALVVLAAALVKVEPKGPNKKSHFSSLIRVSYTLGIIVLSLRSSSLTNSSLRLTPPMSIPPRAFTSSIQISTPR